MTRYTYEDIVDSLVTEGVGGQYVQKRITVIRSLDAYAGKHVVDDLEAIILEGISQRALAQIDTWPESQGFGVQVDSLDTGTSRIILRLSESRYRAVFMVLCDNAVEVMEKASEEEEAVRLLHQRLGHWQSFLKRHGPKGLSPEARRGIFGELLVMRDLFIPRLGQQSAVQGWRGWTKAAQDFQVPGCALEVKTTRAVIPDRISVSNVQQLDGEGMEHMLLTVVHVDENETAGETLPDIVASLRSTLIDSARDQLDQGLEEVGYLDVHEDLYARTRYQCRDILHFDVREGFPRLTRDSIPDGIKGVRYEVTIDACRPFQLDEEEDVVLRLLSDGAPLNP